MLVSQLFLLVMADESTFSREVSVIIRPSFTFSFMLLLMLLLTSTCILMISSSSSLMVNSLEGWEKRWLLLEAMTDCYNSNGSE